MSNTLEMLENDCPGLGAGSVRKQLEEVEYLTLEEAYRGLVRTPHGHRGELLLDAVDNLRFTLFEIPDALAPKTDSEACEATVGLPGNARFALIGGKRVLVADVPLQQGDEVARRLTDCIRGIDDTLHGTAGAAVSGASREDWLEAVETLQGAGLEMVSLDSGDFEFRGTFRHGVPVRMTFPEGGARLASVTVAPNMMPAATQHATTALSLWAQRNNGLIRHARYALCDGMYSAEVRLEQCHLEPTRLALALRAVMSASRQAVHLLRVMATRPDLSRRYVEIFGDRTRKDLKKA